MTTETPHGGLKIGDRVAFSYMPDYWHKATIQGFCFSGRIQIVDDNGKTHVFWSDELRKEAPFAHHECCCDDEPVVEAAPVVEERAVAASHAASAADQAATYVSRF